MANIGDLSIAIKAVDEASAVLKNIQKNLNGLDEAAKKTANSGLTKFSNTLNSVGKSMQSFGSRMTVGVTLPLAYLSKKAVDTAATFEDALYNTFSVLGDVIEEDKKALEALALQMGRDTPFSAKEAAEAMYFLGSAGLDTQKIFKTLPGVLGLAEATQSDIAYSAEMVVESLSRFNLEASESQRVTDVFTKGIASSQLTIERLGEFMKYAGITASQFNGTIEETVGLGATLSKVFGPNMEQAGTGVNYLFNNIIRGGNKTNEALAELGLSMDKANPSKAGMIGAIKNLINAFNKIQDPMKRSKLAAELFGVEGNRVFEVLRKQGVPTLEAFIKAEEEAAGTTEKMAETQRESLGFSIKQLKSSYETLQIAMVKAFGPELKDIIDRVTAFANKIAGLDKETKQLIIKVVGFVAVLGPAVYVLGTMARAISSIISLGTKLNVVVKTAGGLLKVLKSLGGISIVLTVGFLAIEKALEAAGKLKEAMSGFTDASDAGSKTTTDLTNKALALPKDDPKRKKYLELAKKQAEDQAKISSDLADDLGMIQKYGLFAGLMENMGEIATKIGSFLSGIKDKFANWGGEIKAYFSEVWTGFGIIFDEWQVKIGNAVNGVITWFQLLPSRIWAVVKEIPYAIGYIAGVIWKFATYDVPNAITATINWFASLPSKIYTFLVALGTTISTKFTEIKNWLVGWATSTITSLINWFASLPGKIASVASNIYSTVAEKFSSIKAKAIEITKSMVSSVVDFIKSIPSKIKTLGEDLWNTIKNAFKYVVGKVSDLADFGKQIWESVKQGLKDAAGSIWDKIKSGFESGSKHDALGGPVSTGKSYIVGEKGRELFVPSTSGKIIPNNVLEASLASGGSGGSYNISVNVGMYAGTYTDKRKLGEEIFNAYNQIRQAKGLSPL